MPYKFMPGKGRMAGINMTEEMYEVLDQLSWDQQRSRSYIVENLLRSHPDFKAACKKYGVSLPTRPQVGGSIEQMKKVREARAKKRAKSKG